MKPAKDYYLNERSLTKVSSRTIAHEVMRIFIQTAAALQRYGLGNLRHSDGIEWNMIELADSYYVYRWLKDSDIERELKSRFKSIVTRSPLVDSGDIGLTIAAQETDIYFDGIRTLGMNAAYHAESLVLSLATSNSWEIPNLDAKMTVIQTERMIDKPVTIKNISCLEHCLEHINWIKNQVSLPDIHHSNPLPFKFISSIISHSPDASASAKEKIAKYKAAAKEIASLNFYEHNIKLTKINDRLVFNFGDRKSVV